MTEDIEKKIKSANRSIYNNKSIDAYNSNKSIFNSDRKKAYIAIFNNLTSISGNDMYLDVGTGTGNLLRVAKDLFKRCYAVDIGDQLLAKIKPDFPECNFVASDADYLPFKYASFNVISCNALLHHLYSHEKLFEECYKLLKKGGSLYTDHDPNYFLNRFYHIYYKVRFVGKKGFGSEEEELAEYHNTYSAGINPEYLKKILLEKGFSKVKIQYRVSDKKSSSFFVRIILSILRNIVKVIPLKSFYTHFSIIAYK